MGYSEPQPGENKEEPIENGGFIAAEENIDPTKRQREVPGLKRTQSQSESIPGAPELFRDGLTPREYEEEPESGPIAEALEDSQATNREAPVQAGKPNPAKPGDTPQAAANAAAPAAQTGKTRLSPADQMTRGGVQDIRRVPKRPGGQNNEVPIASAGNTAAVQPAGSAAANVNTDNTLAKPTNSKAVAPNPANQPKEGLFNRAKSVVGLGKKADTEAMPKKIAEKPMPGQKVPGKAGLAAQATTGNLGGQAPGKAGGLASTGMNKLNAKLEESKAGRAVKGGIEAAKTARDVSRLIATGGVDLDAWKNLIIKYWRPVVSVLAMILIVIGLLFGVVLGLILNRKKQGRTPPNIYAITDSAESMVPGVTAQYEEKKIVACEDNLEAMDLTAEEKNQINALCVKRISTHRNFVIQKGSTYVFIQDDPETTGTAGISPKSLPGPPVNAAFNPNYVVHDQYFTDKDSMTLQDIQHFLEKKKSPLADMDPSKLGDGANGRSAAQIIYEATRNGSITKTVKGKRITSAVSINPMVMLAMLEKEQSLIRMKVFSGTHIVSHKDDGTPIRMSYQNHLDKAAGVLSRDCRGFTKQVNCSVHSLYGYWLVFKNGGSLGGYRVGAKLSLKHGTVTLTNAATAEMYYYNPEISGNSSFHRITLQFFGSEIKRRYASINNKPGTEKPKGSGTMWSNVPTSFVNANDFSNLFGMVAPSAQAADKAVPLIKQNDYKHVAYPRDGKYFDSNKKRYTLASSGCAIVSTSMVLEYYDKDYSNPEELACIALGKDTVHCNNSTPVTKTVYRSKDNGTSHTWFSFIAAGRGLTGVSLGGDGAPIDWNGIIRQLQQKHPVIVSGSRPDTMTCNNVPFTSGGHFVVLTGINSNGTIKVNDPLRSKGSCKREGSSYSQDSLKNTVHFAYVMYK